MTTLQLERAERIADQGIPLASSLFVPDYREMLGEMR